MAQYNDHEAMDKKIAQADDVYELDPSSPEEEVTPANGTTQDSRDMSRLGKAQQFQRNFRYISMLGFSSTLMATWECALATAGLALINGGLGGFVWTFLITTICFQAVVASMADMASMAPTTGGQYHWVSEFAPKSKQRFLSYMAGWTSALGWQAALASACFLSATMIQGLLVLNHENYVPERWHGTLLLVAIALVATFVNTYGARHLPMLEGIILLLHILGFFAIIIPLWVLSPKVSASAVFTSFNNGGGWLNAAAACTIGQLSSLFSFLGADCVAHMSEEIRDASKIVPRTMVSTVTLNGVMGFVAVITFCFCITDLDAALASSTGYPFIEVFYAATNSKAAATGMVVIFILLIICAAISNLATASRQVFAFARDHGLPYPQVVSKVSKVGVEIPLNAILISLTITTIIGLVNIGSTAAFNSIVSLVVAADLSTYGLAIGCVLLRRLRGLPLLPTRWSMGRWAVPVNVLSLAYIAFALLMSFFPTAKAGLTPQSMNYSSVIYFGVIGIALVLYFVHGRSVYKGPVTYVRRLD
ncbi:hypothetical protein W97_07882 [Coniosporium apollinis CBS 100218]|uniref:Amino acid permease n=1 Tax=Coniosporium apollinis (strain CBS 100218) TaxID=1168221 RepID=R7Z3P4_CONA1|nr:uncharacterized protein W97_07882 [Coniosporium apollinis CBS 100218]EON68624.1 hypothetical protein W97_07882 [Coniosporium apollinis CBS 100218]